MFARGLALALCKRLAMLGEDVTLRFFDHFHLGAFAKYNRLFQRAHGRGDVRYAVGGLLLSWDIPVGDAAE